MTSTQSMNRLTTHAPFKTLHHKVSLSKEHQTHHTHTHTHTDGKYNLVYNNMFNPHNGGLIYQSNSVSLMETVILQTVMTLGRKPHNSITNIYQQISTQ